MKTKGGFYLRVYGWEVSEDRSEPKVFLGADFYPLSASFTLTPSEARELAAMIVQAADTAEGGSHADSPN